MLLRAAGLCGLLSELCQGRIAAGGGKVTTARNIEKMTGKVQSAGGAALGPQL